DFICRPRWPGRQWFGEGTARARPRAGRSAFPQWSASMDGPRILAVGTAVPPTSFTQDELIDIFRYTDPPHRSVLRQRGLERRHCSADAGRVEPDGNVDRLAAGFEAGRVALRMQAVRACLGRQGLDASEIDFLATTTCTGRLVPSLDARLMRAGGFRD